MREKYCHIYGTADGVPQLLQDACSGDDARQFLKDLGEAGGILKQTRRTLKGAEKTVHVQVTEAVMYHNTRGIVKRRTFRHV